MPGVTPVTVPLMEPTVATDVLALLHVPPVETSLSVILEPAATVKIPESGAGVGLTVNTIVALLVPSEYEIIQVPAVTPVTTPVEEPTVAIPVLLLLQLPPEVVSDKVLVEPTQTLAIPLMGLTTIAADTCTVCDVWQPVGNV